MKKLLAAVFVALMGLSQPVFADSPPLNVVASFSILGDMVKTVGGGAVQVTTLVGPDSDTHTYQPTPDDAKALAKADVIFVNGLGFEGWMQRLIAASGTKAKIIVASNGVKPRTMVEDEGQTVTDPHAWQNPANGRIYAQNIAAALEAARPEQAQAIKDNAAKYDAEIADADKYIRQQLAGIPESKRKIITSHDAFGYFGAAYDIKFLAPLGMSTESEAAASDVAKLIEQIKAEGVKQVFIENMTDPRLIKQIARDSGAQMGGALFSDALSQPDGSAPTYLAMFRNNVPKLKAAMELNGR